MFPEIHHLRDRLREYFFAFGIFEGFVKQIQGFIEVSHQVLQILGLFFCEFYAMWFLFRERNCDLTHPQLDV